MRNRQTIASAAEGALLLTAIIAGGALTACGSSDRSQEQTETQTSELTNPAGAIVGALVFVDPFPGTQGNGRACATCHVPRDSFALTPAHVEAHYQALQLARQRDPDADDPLFRSIDADDGAQDYTMLRQHALVHVTIKLPTDADGNKLVWPLDDPGATEVTLSRSTPTIFNVAMTAPYQWDGRFATLQDQALGALVGHAQIQRPPNPLFLDDVAAFEQTQFSSFGAAAVSRAIALGQPPPDPDPPLDDLETQGKALFQHHCTVCHGGPSQTQPDPAVSAVIAANGGVLTDLFVSRPLPPFTAGLPFGTAPPLPVRLWAVRVPNQPAPIVRPSTDPGKVLITGSIHDFQAFEVPTVLGASRTAPYFHDNSAATLAEVLVHYQSLFLALRRVVPPTVPFPFRPDVLADADIPALLAYLNKI